MSDYAEMCSQCGQYYSVCLDQEKEISELEEIARRSGAWKTADGRWVYDNDMVYYRMHDGIQLSMKAKDVLHVIRGKCYSTPN
jgi:hypothetical protein